MSKVVVNGQEVAPAPKVKLPKGVRIADVVPPYVKEGPRAEKESG